MLYSDLFSFYSTYSFALLRPIFPIFLMINKNAYELTQDFLLDSFFTSS